MLQIKYFKNYYCISILVTNYPVVSQRDRFRDYLQDAKRIFMETIAANGQTLGFAVIDRLERIVDFGGITLDDLEVFNEKHEVIAVLRCMFMYEEIKTIDNVPDRKSAKGRVTFKEIPRHVSEEEEDPDYDEVISQIISQNEVNEKQVQQVL